jgi:hypothetical protein
MTGKRGWDIGELDREIHRRKSSRKFVARQERLWAEMDEAPNMKTGKEKKVIFIRGKRPGNPLPESHDWQKLRSDGTKIGVKVKLCNVLMQ